MTQEATDWLVSRHFNTDITTLRCFRVIQAGKESSNLSQNLILSKFAA